MLLALDLTRFRRLETARSLAPMAVLAAAGMVLFAWLCDAVGERDGITAIDGPTSVWIAAHRSITEGHIGLLLARLTSPVVLVAVVALVSAALWLTRHRFEAVALAITVVAAYGIGGLAKIAEHRPRPVAPVNLAPEAEGSFPSGHVLIVATIAIVLVVLAWSHLSASARALAVAAAVVVTTVMAADRLLVGAHWLTDVVASVAVALVLGAVVMAVTQVRRRALAFG